MTETSEHQQESPSSKGGAGFLEFIVILLVAFSFVFGIIRPFVLEAFYIPSPSMVPTLEVGDHVFINKFIYRFHEPKQGDIVVFKSVEGDDEDLIKRVMGVGGDEIELRNGGLYVNSQLLEEPYLNEKYPDYSSFGPVTVPEGTVFVMGDNRGDSEDSRYFGPLPLKNIEGKAFVIYWPVGHIRLL